ncbi:MAG TPA: DUF3224 domain-containing protein [Marmoricola sp.]
MDLKLRIANWDEKTSRELPEGQRLARADVTLGEDGDDLGGTSESLMHYLSDGTSTYASVMHLSGSLDGRSGSFTLVGTGTYDGTTATGTSTIVPGSGTGELAGITGTATSSSTHADYPYMPLCVDYSL